jgi:hypothetical protein
MFEAVGDGSETGEADRRDCQGDACDGRAETVWISGISCVLTADE